MEVGWCLRAFAFITTLCLVGSSSRAQEATPAQAAAATAIDNGKDAAKGVWETWVDENVPKKDVLPKPDKTTLLGNLRDNENWQSGEVGYAAGCALIKFASSHKDLCAEYEQEKAEKLEKARQSPMGQAMAKEREQALHNQLASENANVSDVGTEAAASACAAMLGISQSEARTRIINHQQQVRQQLDLTSSPTVGSAVGTQLAATATAAATGKSFDESAASENARVAAEAEGAKTVNPSPMRQPSSPDGTCEAPDSADDQDVKNILAQAKTDASVTPDLTAGLVEETESAISEGRQGSNNAIMQGMAAASATMQAQSGTQSGFNPGSAQKCSLARQQEVANRQNIAENSAGGNDALHRQAVAAAQDAERATVAWIKGNCS